MAKEFDISSLFDSNGRALPGFSGIGALKGRNDYSEEERTVLNHFFTRSDSNIYAATDAMPSQLWALLMGQFARSDQTAKDRFLKLFRDMHEKNTSSPTVEELAGTIKSSSDITEKLSAAIRYAGKWIEEWGVGYGHASLRDSGTVRMCVEGVSQRGTKPFESAREGAYQEISTRAVPFTEANLGIPYEIRGTEFENQFRELARGHIALYNELMTKLPVHLNAKHADLRRAADEQVKEALQNREEALSDRVWEGTLKEKAFDVARYLIPQFMTTSLGITLNARRFQDQLTEWQSSEFAEIQALGRAAQTEALRLNPELMKYGDRSEYVAALPQRRRELFRELASNSGELNLGSDSYGEMQIGSRLVSATPNIEDLMLASVLLAGSDGRQSFTTLVEKVKELSPRERREIVESQFEGKKSHELNPKVFEVGAMVFERLYDIGAFRDLQRQRGDRQQIGPYGMIGYVIPDEVKEVGLGENFTQRMEEGKIVYDRLVAAGMPHVAEYATAMANIIRHISTKDPTQLFYEAKLRNQAAGIDSYRTIARHEIEAGLELMPAFKGLIEYDANKYPLNRLPEKIKGYVEMKRKKAASQVNK